MKLRIAIVAVALALFFVGTASAVIYTVDDSSGKDFLTIQEAVDAAEDGDIVEVYPGTYIENVVIVKDLNITSFSGNPEDTIVQAANRNKPVFDLNAFYNEPDSSLRVGNNVEISGFTISDGSFGISVGEGDVAGSNHTFSNNVITDNVNGIFIQYSLYNKVNENIISNNDERGVYIVRTSNNVLTGNVISSSNEGVLIEDSIGNRVENNTIYETNDAISGIYIDDCDFINNYIYSNNFGIRILNYASFADNGNNITNNVFYSNLQTVFLLGNNYFLATNTVYSNSYGISISGSSNTLIGNTVYDNREGIACEGNSNLFASNSVYENTDFGIKSDGNYNDLTSNEANSNTGYGIVVMWGDHNNLINNTCNSNTESGILLAITDNNQIVGNTIKNNILSGIDLVEPSQNKIYNNYFENNLNLLMSDYDLDETNCLNTTKSTGTNIVNGPYLGGNYWAKPDGTGFSQTHPDTDGDGFCDEIYIPISVEGSACVNSIDYLPLAVYTPNNEPITTCYLTEEDANVAYSDDITITVNTYSDSIIVDILEPVETGSIKTILLNLDGDCIIGVESDNPDVYWEVDEDTGFGNAGFGTMLTAVNRVTGNQNAVKKITITLDDSCEWDGVLPANEDGYGVVIRVNQLPGSPESIWLGGNEEDGNVTTQEIPEFPTITIPLIAIVGLSLIFKRK
ncbi:parallel beta-helix repeat (two copies) [Methanolobus vulcani]|uniref:Parallel beta-helix repeat (Two copies) n=1 Tax=Methanolobus vulcani TaxID=38026 RepID=A0A7Z7AU70_9EURY|nr:NosD domain-containing protein [Methanolobus vulcani]SDF24777.1 parallel beta-helix repeat (two copies) [Methanolobus vulcani]